MYIRQLGLQLQLLSERDIELVRQWRNSPQVNNRLFTTENISAEQQMAWFKKIQSEQNLYFLVVQNGIKCGLVYLTNIDWSERSFETNIFMGPAEYQSSFVPVYAALTVSDLFFVYLQFKTAASSTVPGNTVADFFDENFGYSLTALENDRHLLKSDRYSFFKSSERLRRAISRTGKVAAPEIFYSKDELHHPMCGRFLQELLGGQSTALPQGFLPISFSAK